MEHNKNLSYSNEAFEAVRYGFQYRKTSEELAKSDSERLNFCLPDPSEILIFLAEAIIGGIVYDALKSIAVKTWSKFKDQLSLNKEQEVYNILTKDDDLVEFYTYIREFHEKSMRITEQQEKYIKEEVIADYNGEQASIIFSKYKRHVSITEQLDINKEAHKKADIIIVRKK